MPMKRILNEFVSLFFPDLCVVCRKPLVGGEEEICLTCLNRLPYIRNNTMQNPAEQLFAGSNLHSANTFLNYEKGGITQRLIYSLKYHNNKKLGYTLGKMSARQLLRQESFEQPDLLIPVPLHKKRLRQRGYNQSEWIAKGMNDVFQKTIDTTTLVRTRKTETQTRKTLYERLTSIETAFQLTQEDHLVGKHILLVDDVMTTGATLNACINQLTRCKGIKISVFTLAVAQ